MLPHAQAAEALAELLVTSRLEGGLGWKGVEHLGRGCKLESLGFGHLGGSNEIFERRSDFVLLDDFLQLALQVGVELGIGVTLLLGVVAVEDADLLVLVGLLPGAALVLLVKVDDEERVLEVDEEVTHVGHLLGLFFVKDDVDGGVPVFVRLVDLLLQLVLRKAARDVLDAKIRPRVYPLLHQLDPHRLAVVRPVRLRLRARVLASRSALRVVTRLLLRRRGL